MEDVCSNHDPVIITRTKAEPVVIISLKDFEAMKETYYLMKSPKNAARIVAAINEAELMIARKRKKEKESN